MLSPERVVSRPADYLKMHARSRRLAQLELQTARRRTDFDTQRDRVVAAFQACLGLLRSERLAIDPNMRRLGRLHVNFDRTSVVDIDFGLEVEHFGARAF